MKKLFYLLLMCGTMAGAQAQSNAPAWEWAGWGGGGFFFSAVFHPSKDGVLYMGGDVAGVYKSEDHGGHWRLVNSGLASYAIYSLAVDRTAPDTVFAATEEGLCKSTNGGEQWRVLPNTGRKELRITGERMKSIRAIAVDPTDGKIVYAGSPAGKVFKSTDGGESWQAVLEKADDGETPETLRVQFGKVNDNWFGGFWLPVTFPQGATAAECAGFGFHFKGDGTLPRECYLSLKAANGAAYRSRNLRELFKQTQWSDVVLGAKDFELDADYVKSHPEQAKNYSGTPDWATVNRMDFACVGPLMNEAPVGKFTSFFFALKGATPAQRVVREFSKDKKLQIYGNLRIGPPQGGTVYSVAVAAKEPSFVLAATDDQGLMASRDAGKTWQALNTPKKASSVAVAESDPNIVFATFFKDGVWKSSDKGQTWKNLSQSLPKNLSAHEVAVSPANPLDVYLIAAADWNGRFFYSNDGGETWTNVSKLTPDFPADPTLPKDPNPMGLSAPRNITINPLNPKEIFIAANWRPCLSADGGRTWAEKARGADISCVYDVRFFKGRTYASAMDEGVYVSDDNGGQWRALWPLKYEPVLGGHYWRLAISEGKGGDRIVSTFTPWNGYYANRVVISDDGGKTFAAFTNGLPTKNPTANTMWGVGGPRALATDPKNPNVLYLGIDGDPSGGKGGGGIFKSVDGGQNWSALAAQPGCRRSFFGLAVDPTDSQRLFWATCGTGGGLYRSEDGGASWQHVFKNESWSFNLHVAADGTVYCTGNNLWRSTDHGKSWKQLTKFPYTPRIIVAIESDPTDSKRLWFATTTWSSGQEGGVFETRDGGASWQEITSNLPYRKPMVLRFNPDTHELWAIGVCLFKCKR